MGHEDLRREGPAAGSSDRSFGWVFAAVFAVIALQPLLHGAPVRTWSIMVAALFALAASAAPRVLAPLNRLWTRVGAAIHAVVTPVVLGAVYCVAVVPSGLVMRLLGRDPLRLRGDAAASTYWIDRRPPGPPPESFRDPF
jgi:Saxitoxin biosynthesis operon protein SxtJ